MRIAFPVFCALVALVALAPCAFADEAMPAAPGAAPGAGPEKAPAAGPAAPSPTPAGSVVGDCGCCPQPSTCCPPRDPCRPGRLEIQAGVSFLTPDPEGEVTAPSTAPDEALWDSLDYDLAISGRVAWTFAAGDWDITAAGTFWGLWDEEQDIGPARFTSNFGSTVFANVLLESDAMLWDINLTATKPFYCSPCFTASWGAGVRYLRFDEESSFTYGPPTNTQEADIHNGLLAAEGVVEAVWKLSNRWDFFARASAFAGWLHVSGEVTSTEPGLPAVDSTDSDDRFGYGGELEVALRWHMNSCWTFSVGYDLLALGEVSRGYTAIDNTNFAPGGTDYGPLFGEDWITVHRVYVGVVFDL